MKDQIVEKTYFPLVDIARFFSALSVVFFHYFSLTAATLSAGFAKIYLENAFLGVQLFFIISGFVIYFSLFSGIKKYVIGRFLRIYPLFWFCMTTTYLVTVFFSEHHASIATYLFNFLIINNGKTALMIDGSYWTLTHELLFYVYIGLFVYFFGHKRIHLFFYLWLSLLSLGVLSGFYNMFFFKVALIRSGFYFIFGGLLAYLFYTWKFQSLLQKLTQILSMVWSVVMVLILSRSLQNDNVSITNHFGIYTLQQEYIVIGLFVLMCTLVACSQFIKGSLNLRFAMVCGAITYPLYLLHQVIGSVLLGRVGVYGYFCLESVTFICFLVFVSYIISEKEKRVRLNLQQKMLSLLS